MPFTRTVLEVAQRAPDRIAIAAGGRCLRYGELVADSRQLMAAVRHLQAQQTQPPTPAAETQGRPLVATSTTSAFATARIFAELAGYGVVSATIDPRWPLAHRVGVVTRSGACIVVADTPDLAPALANGGWGGSVIAPDALETLQASLPPAEAPTVRAGAEPFLMLFSSGTTHNPKAFLKTRRQYRDNYAIASPYLEPLPGVVTWAPGPVSYSLTLWTVLECLASGGTVVLADRFDALAAAQTIADRAVTRVVAVPAMIQALADVARHAPDRFAGLRLLITSGSYLPPATRAAVAAALPQARLISYYGAAEIGFIGNSAGADGTLIDLYAGVQARLRRDDGSDIPHASEELGTLWIRTPACSDGYVAGTSTEALQDAAGWATVHDQGRWAGARLQLVGRAGDIAITGGHKVSLAEVERAFDPCPGARAVCAVALPDAVRGSVVALVVEAVEADQPPARAALQAVAHTRLAPQYVPRQWFAVQRLPRTVSGKLRRGATAELVASGQAQAL